MLYIGVVEDRHNRRKTTTAAAGFVKNISSDEPGQTERAKLNQSFEASTEAGSTRDL